jgi:uncharacterized membrane protein YraQ (UPF0718 family)
MAKRKKTKKKKNTSSLLRYTAWFLTIIALILTSLIIGYYLGLNNANTKTIIKEKVIVKEKKTTKIPKAPVSVNKRLKEVLQKACIS